MLVCANHSDKDGDDDGDDDNNMLMLLRLFALYKGIEDAISTLRRPSVCLSIYVYKLNLVGAESPHTLPSLLFFPSQATSPLVSPTQRTSAKGCVDGSFSHRPPCLSLPPQQHEHEHEHGHDPSLQEQAQ